MIFFNRGMFVLLIVIGSKGFSDFVNDILSSLHFDLFNWKPSARDFVTNSSTKNTKINTELVH